MIEENIIYGQSPYRRGKIAFGYVGTGKEFSILGPPINIDGISWVPIIFDDEDDPTWFKNRGIELIKANTPNT